MSAIASQIISLTVFSQQFIDAQIKENAQGASHVEIMSHRKQESRTQ